MQYLTIIKTVLALLPTIIDAVRAIEQAFPMSSQGSTKLAAIRSIVETAYQTTNEAVLSFDMLWPTIQSAVGAVVSIANATGLFKKQ